jgi:hypothetical protein
VDANSSQSIDKTDIPCAQLPGLALDLGDFALVLKACLLQLGGYPKILLFSLPELPRHRRIDSQIPLREKRQALLKGTEKALPAPSRPLTAKGGLLWRPLIGHRKRRARRGREA